MCDRAHLHLHREFKFVNMLWSFLPGRKRIALGRKNMGWFLFKFARCYTLKQEIRK